MKLNKKIKDRTAKIGVIGLGYVGLPLAIEFVQAGFNVVGIDIDENKINSINRGKNYINPRHYNHSSLSPSDLQPK